MQNTQDISQYKIIGTLSNNPNFSAWIASNSNNPVTDAMFLINRFPYNKLNQSIFKDLFSYYSSNNKSKDMINFFASKDSFYIIFKYIKSQSIKEKFEESNITTDYKTRCFLLKNILLKIESLKPLPLYALLCVTDINNICVDNNDKIQIIYNLSKVSEFNEMGMDSLYKNISTIINVLLSHEINSKYYTQLKLVVEKCENNLYESIPELIVDLEKAEKTVSEHNRMDLIKTYIKKNKKKVICYSVIGGSALLLAISVFLIPTFINSFKNKTSPIFSLGNIKYNIPSEKGNDTGILPIDINTSSDTSEDLDYSIPADSGLPSEDYVVQYGDTISTICSSHYKNQKFTTTIETFNNIYDIQLSAGIIIKLPDESAALDYIENK